MDSLTHLAIGACMGEAFAGRTLGKKAMLWGALAQSIPDIDFITALWMDTPSQLLAHRGFTHSFLFCLIMAILLALAAEKLHRPHNIRTGRWFLFFGGAIFIHIFLDAFNNYGVGWFEPFSHARLSFNAIYVADPFLSVFPAIGCAGLIALSRWNPKRSRWWKTAFWGMSIYLGFCLYNKYKIDKEVRKSLQQQQISYSRFMTTPAPLQNWLWYLVAETDSGFRVGFHSLFDTAQTIPLQYFPRNEALLSPVHNSETLQRLRRFSQGYYTAEKWSDTLVFNDLRFGQMLGWENPRGRFVFHYFLHRSADNSLVVQRGRFNGWNTQTVLNLLKRISANSKID
jgi:inner membrane protein